MTTEQFGADWLEEEGETQPQPETPEPVAEDEPKPEAAEGEEEAADTQAASDKPDLVPLGALEKERKAKQAEKARREELEREIAELRAGKPQQAPPKIPDAYEDPDGFAAYQEQRLAQTEWNLRAAISERFAKQQHGEEVVNEATDWGLERAKGDPGFAQKVMAHPDPVGFTLQEYQQSKTLETLAGRPFEDAAKEYAISQGWIVSEPGAATAATTQKPSQPKPLKSLASAPGGGAPKPTVDAFESVFNDKGLGLRK